MTNNQLIAMMAAQIYAANEGMKQYQALDAARDIAAACGVKPEIKSVCVPVDVVERLVDAVGDIHLSSTGSEWVVLRQAASDAVLAIAAARDAIGKAKGA